MALAAIVSRRTAESLKYELIGAAQVGGEHPGIAPQPRQQDENVVLGRRVWRGHRTKQCIPRASLRRGGLPASRAQRSLER